MLLTARAAQPVGLKLDWCWGRCRTFLEHGPFFPNLTDGRIPRLQSTVDVLIGSGRPWVDPSRCEEI